MEEEIPNGRFVKISQSEETLYGIFNRLLSSIVFPSSTDSAKTSVFHRIKVSVSDNAPLLPEASRNSGRNLLVWTRKGSPFRALFVISVGTITLLALTGLLVFMLFFVAATANAVIISLLLSLAATGGFLALFFASLTAIYIGALSVAVFVISAVTISTIVAVTIVTGWVGFFFTVWFATKKSAALAKHSLGLTGSAISSFSSARHAHRNHETDPY